VRERFPYRRWMRLVAALVLMAMSTALLYPFPPLGIGLMAAGAGIALYQAVQIWRERRDPYDLSRLFEQPPDEPEETDDTDREMIFCHRCGVSVPGMYSLCPECGGVLGQ